MLRVIVDFGTLDLFGLSVPLHIQGYGLMIVLGFLCAAMLLRWRAKRVGENPEVLLQCGLLAFIGGLIGSRIAYVIQHWESFFSRTPNPVAEMLNLTSGGLIYYGGVILATAIILIYLAIKRYSIRRHLDILAVSVMVGLAFGRAGCLLNGCCYGARCSGDWPMAMRFPMYSRPLVKFDGRDNPFSTGMTPSPVYDHQFYSTPPLVQPDPRLLDADGRLIPPEDYDTAQVKLAKAQWSGPVKPAQALGIANALLIAAILTYFYRLRRRDGQVFALMMICYPITRFALESIRSDNAHDLARGMLTHNQWTSLAMTAGGVIMMLVLQKMPAGAGESWKQRQDRLVPAQSGGERRGSDGQDNSHTTRKKRHGHW